MRSDRADGAAVVDPDHPRPCAPAPIGVAGQGIKFGRIDRSRRSDRRAERRGAKFPVEDYVAMAIGNHEIHVVWLDTQTHDLLGRGRFRLTLVDGSTSYSTFGGRVSKQLANGLL